MTIPHAYPPDTLLNDLRTAETLLVTTLRLYALNVREPGRHPDWRGGFAAAGVLPSGSGSFQALFDIVVMAPRRPLDVRCLHCAGLGYDEGRLLQLVSLFQHRRSTDAEAILDEWLPPAARRLAMPAASGLAVALHRGRLIIPWRRSEAVAVPAHQLQSNPGLALVQ